MPLEILALLKQSDIFSNFKRYTPWGPVAVYNSGSVTVVGKAGRSPVAPEASQVPITSLC
jgi:hypothetical protein